MGNIQIQSVAREYEDPSVLAYLMTLFTRADAMGLLSGKPISELTPTTVRAVFKAFRTNGLMGAHQPQLELLLHLTPSEGATTAAASALSDFLNIVEESPAPGREWSAMRKIFGDEDLASLMGISSSSLKRYAREERPTPDKIADRLHWLAMVVADLSGSYNEIGIRRWFERPRVQLEGKNPRQLLGTKWTAGTPAARRVRELAESLTSSGAT
jgi:uncharacterized protein (DUF2384 family)